VSDGDGAGQRRLTLIVFSNSLDKLLAAFILATGAAASDVEVHMFFTFWGLTTLRDAKKRTKKDLLGRLFGFMLPKGPDQLPLSQLNMAGMGPAMIRKIMKDKKQAPLPELMDAAAELHVNIWLCETSMGMLGMSRDEMIDYPHLQVCGVAKCIELSEGGMGPVFI